MEFVHEAGDKYDVTGVDRNGKRFKLTYDNPRWALAINVWRGSVWQRKTGGRKRKLIKVVHN